MNKFGHFENTPKPRGGDRGYRLDKIRDDPYLKVFTKTIYEFTLDPILPLTFHATDGTRIQPDRHLAETDKGSVPLSLQIFIPKDRFLFSFLMHDSGYKHGGLYVARKGSQEFKFEPMSRLDLDTWLKMMVGAENGNLVQRSAIYNGVRLGGWASWDHGTLETRRKQAALEDMLS
jgi:hypothetical protein